MSTLDFQLSNHAALSVIRHAAVVQKTPGQVHFIVALKHVLFVDVPEDSNGFIEHLLECGIIGCTRAFAQVLIDEQRDVFGRTHVHVDKGVHRLVNSSLTALVAVETRMKNAIKPVLGIKHLIYPRQRNLSTWCAILTGQRCLVDRLASVRHIHSKHLVQRIQTRWHETEQAVHAFNIGTCICIQQRHKTTVVHVQDGI